MILPIKRFLAKKLDSLVLFKSYEFQVTALDVVRRTPNLRSHLSPLSCYLEWRHNEIMRLGLTIDHVDVKKSSLEDTFAKLTGLEDAVSELLREEE